jgi:hypothetical protein
MRIDYERLLSEVREDCGNPDPHTPTDDLILQKAGDDAQLLMNQMQNAPPGWSQHYKDLPVYPEKSIYVLENWDNFTKPVRVHTIDLNNPYHVNRKILTCERQNVDAFYEGSSVATAAGWSAQVMVFYQHYAEHRVEILPAPNDAVWYRIWYNTGIIEDPMRANAAPVPPEYFRYLRLKTSLAVLPYCLWSGKDDQVRFLKIMGSVGSKKTPGTGLLGKVREFSEEWENYIQTSRISGSQGQELYLSSYLNSWF